jgi:tRNA/tmRNA/rRNA uracil-C5-methylase (TrmA/RlmC/RlmD family)
MSCPVREKSRNWTAGRTIAGVSSPVVVTLHGFAHGGEAVGRMPDGKTVFVAHTIPGETVTVRVVSDHKRWCRAELVEILEPSDDRVAAPCPYFGPGKCGGCTLQHISGGRRRTLQRQVVIDQLERLGGISDPPVAAMVPAGDYGYRSRARFSATDAGLLGFRRHASHDIVPVDRCLLLDDPTHAARAAAGDDWPDAEFVEIRTGVEGHTVLATVGSTTRVAAGDRALTEQVAGLRYHVSARSFFQANRQGAEALVRLVRGGAAIQPGTTVLDLYAGVGLFAAALQADGAAVTAVEGHPVGADDARRNLGAGASVITAPVERAVRELHAAERRFDVVVLDPPRKGAGKAVIQTVAALAERVIVVVACDPAALGRDAGVLTRNGWTLHEAVPVDQFAQTGHIEVVATFRR